MSDPQARSGGRPLLQPLGVVGPGSSPGSRQGPSGTGQELSGSAPRRFVVPDQHRGPDGTRLEEFLELRRLTREGALLLGVEQATVLLFRDPGEPILQATRFRYDSRKFEPQRDHPPGLRSALRESLVREGRVEVADGRGESSSGGGLGRALRDYLEEGEIQAILALPLHARGGVAGMIAFETLSGTQKWTREDRERAGELAERMERTLTPSLLASLARSSSRASEALAPPSLQSSMTPMEGPATAPEKDSVAESNRNQASNGVPSPFPETSSETTSRPEPEAEREDGQAASQTSLPTRAHTGESTTGLDQSRESGISAVGSDLAGALLHLVSVQEGTLELLDGSEALATETRELVGDLHDLTGKFRSNLQALRELHASFGQVGEEVLELSHHLASLVYDLARIAGDGPRFVVAPGSDPLPVRANVLLLRRALEELVRVARESCESGDRIRISWGLTHASPPASSGDQGTESLSEGRSRSSGTEIREVARIQLQEDGGSSESGGKAAAVATREKGGSRDRDQVFRMARGTIEAHGGWIEPTTTGDGGTLLTLFLPLVEQELAANQSPGAAGESVGPRILLLEDEPTLARLLTRALSRHGFQVEAAASDREGQGLWVRSREAFDLVIVDRQVPGAWDAKSLVAGWGAGDRPPLLVLDRSDVEMPAPGIRVDTVLTPPLQPARVLEAVRTLLAEATEKEQVPSDDPERDGTPSGLPLTGDGSPPHLGPTTH